MLYDLFSLVHFQTRFGIILKFSFSELSWEVFDRFRWLRLMWFGYRTPWSNEFLRTRRPHTGIVRHSLHMQGQAIDIRLPGIPTSEVRDAALRLHRGGVGYYRSSDFVHVDVGRVRQW